MIILSVAASEIYIFIHFYCYIHLEIMSNFLDNLIMNVKIFMSYLQIKKRECIIPNTNHFTLEKDEEG